jgi:undecaprenyl-diphosphatase
MTYLQAIIIAIVEGITEFLPISSTGHMVITASLMGIAKDPFVKTFEIAIQFGAILSVVVLYWRRFLQSFEFYLKLLVGFIPAVVFGLLFYKHIKTLLENPTFIAIVLLVGGVILLFIDEWFKDNETLAPETQTITYRKALIVGCFQVLAMIFPGLSRSAATIVGGLVQKLNRRSAAEFGFFLAVPTMAAATAKDALDYYKDIKAGVVAPLSSHDWGVLAVGNLVAFVVALIAIKTFIGYLTKHGFKVFGYYRIIVGLTILLLQAIGFQLFVN